MSFMVNPHPYDDVNEVNVLDDLIGREEEIYRDGDIIEIFHKELKKGNVSLDGYPSAPFDEIVSQLKDYTLVDVRDFYISDKEFLELINYSVRNDDKLDPYHLFGRIYEGEIEDFFNQEKIDAYFKEHTTETIIIYGIGAACRSFSKYSNSVLYYDRTPKDGSMVVSASEYQHIVGTFGNDFNENLRQYYYIDIMVSMKNRKRLIQAQEIDYLILKNSRNEVRMLDKELVNDILSSLIQRPMRPKPIYLPGVWGGEMIKNVRKLQDKIEERIAWVFEFIPLESSMGIMIGKEYLDFPFYTILNAKENEILGEHIAKKFKGFFPVRVNYDDTWHSDGNMSIQVHPGEDYIKENYGEYGSQDEAYYIVATGHDAVTYCGLKVPKEEFMGYCNYSFINKTTFNYKNFVNHVESKPGLQLMFPGGTLHSSGRNQLVLELGSLTVGSYTYKVYDYCRKDLSGVPRPIHIGNGYDVLEDRGPEWVRDNVLTEERVISSNEDISEALIGRNKTMYYETHKVRMNEFTQYESATNGEFVLLSVVDGEQVKISSLQDASKYYLAKYLDVLILPADFGGYKVEALGYQPVVLHKAIMKR